MESSAKNEVIDAMLKNQSFHAINPRLFDEIQEIRSPITSSSKYGDPLPLLSPSVWLSAITHLESIIMPMERILPFYNMGYRYLIANDKDSDVNIDYMLERTESPLRWKPIMISYLDNEMPPLSSDMDCRERTIQQDSPVETNEEKQDRSLEINECISCLEQTHYVCDDCNEPLCEECVTKEGLCSLCTKYYTNDSSEYYSD
jgi:hypothetical protein